MKIALYELTTTVSHGGLQTSYWETAKRLALMGHEIHMYGGDGPVRWEMPGNVKILTFPFTPRSKFPDFGSRFRKFAERISFGKHALSSLIRNEYDVVYIRKPFEMPIALHVKRRTGARVVFRSGGTEFYPGYKFFAKKLDVFLACSKYNAEQIYDYCGIKPHVLYNGIDTDLFSPRAPDAELKNKLHLGEGESVVISVCRLVGWKGIQYAIRSVAALISDNFAVKYLIIGDGEYREKLESLSKELKLDKNIIFLGRMKNSDIPLFYSIADVAVFPSVADETFGISIGEAMSCGVAVVSTNVGGIPEVVAEDGGILVPPKDEHSLARAIKILISDQDLRKKVNVSGRKRIIENFSWDVITKEFERYIQSA
jgi:glycosyltransferase involved in cell wall biosynthesis